MSAVATVEPAAVQAPPKPAERIRIPAKVQQAIDLLESGECKTQKAAAVRVGISDQHLCRMLKREQVQVFIARRRAENIAMGSLRASRRYVQLVDAESEHVAAKVSERILEQTGDLRIANSGVNVNVNNSISVGYIVDLTPQAPGARTIENEAQHEPK
ncbi:MAG: hypothetical protein LC750_00430 [Actinobacteria bacterium]|nr:hypothetical protein [Actinomycetota bacterium]